MRLSKRDITAIDQVLKKNTFRRKDFSRLLLDIFWAWGLPRRVYSYKSLKQAFYFENFERNGQNPIYNAISAALYSFSILLTLLKMGGASEEYRLFLSERVADKMAEKISRVLSDNHANENLKAFLSKSFYLSLLAQMDNEGNETTLLAMYYLYEFKYTKGMLFKDKDLTYENCPSVRMRNGQEADIFQSFADILTFICEEDKAFNRTVASKEFNSFIAKTLSFPTNPLALLLKSVVIKFGKPIMCCVFAGLWWKDYITLPYAILAAGFSAWSFKYTIRPLVKSLYAPVEKRIADEANRVEDSIRARQKFLVAEYKQEEEEQNFSRPPLIFSPMKIETETEKAAKESEKRIKEKSQERHQKRRKKKANRQKEPCPTKSDSTLSRYHLTRHNQAILINPWNIITSKGRKLNKTEFGKVVSIKNAARLLICQVGGSFYLKRGNHENTSHRLHVEKRPGRVQDECGNSFQVYEATVYCPKH